MTRINHIKLGLLSAAACMAASCTGDFDSFNTNPDAVQQIDVKNYITTMERDAVIPTSDEGANEYQRACKLHLHLRPRRHGLQQRPLFGGLHQRDARMAATQIRP